MNKQYSSIGEIHYGEGRLPIYTGSESLEQGRIHSGMAHMHRDLELISVVKGSMECQTGDSTFELKAGDICFVNRNQLHALYGRESSTSSHRVLLVGTELLMGMPELYNRYIKNFLEDMRFTHVKFEGGGSHAAEINRLMSKLEEIQEREDEGYELEMMSVLYHILWHLYGAYRHAPSEDMLDGNGLIQQKMADYIYEHYDEALGLDDIAGAGNVSRSQCSKLFKRYTRMAPIAFLNRHRLEMSCDKLRNTKDSIADIALSCGYNDQSYYNRMFMRQYGITPKEYRKRGEKENGNMDRLQ